MAEKKQSIHKCVLCNTLLESKASLKEHFRKHANREIDCRGLPAKPRGQRKIIKQEPVAPKKPKGNPVACDVCGQEFANNTKAIQHKFRKHPNVSAKYICPYCGKLFPIKALFDTHLNTHSSDPKSKNPLFCEECEAKFYNERARSYHLKATHERVKTLLQPIPTPPPSKKIKMNVAGEMLSVYYCHLCGSEYVVKFNLQKHLESAHTDEEKHAVPKDIIRCTVCEAFFYNQRAYETHNISHKSNDLYVTSESQRLQTISRIDQDFDIRRVMPCEDKYVSPFKLKRKVILESDSKDSDEELSPPSSPDTTDSDSDSEEPVILVEKASQAGGISDSIPNETIDVKSTPRRYVKKISK